MTRACLGTSTEERGPTAVMRQEHTQMRGLFEEMERALRSEEPDHYLGLSETLHIMIQQHNLKEEQVLYPMTDRAFGAERDTLLAKIKQAHAGDSTAHSATYRLTPNDDCRVQGLVLCVCSPL